MYVKPKHKPQGLSFARDCAFLTCERKTRKEERDRDKKVNGIFEEEPRGDWKFREHQSQSTVVHVRKEMPRGDASWQIYGAKMTCDRPRCSLLVLEKAVTHGPQLASEGGIPQIKSPWSGAHPRL